MLTGLGRRQPSGGDNKSAAIAERRADRTETHHHQRPARGLRRWRGLKQVVAPHAMVGARADYCAIAADAQRVLQLPANTAADSRGLRILGR